MSTLDLLLHICCAPCATYTIQHWRDRDIAVTGYWFNPNIHPYSEHEKRRVALWAYAQETRIPLFWEQDYALRDFMRAITGHEQHRERCLRCYRFRLERTASAAARRGFDAISTTLLISPYQDQAAICTIGQELAAQHGLLFLADNLRPGYGESRRLAREHHLYMQTYCGCLYSEWERYDQQAATHAKNNTRTGGIV